jgi:hypothetical protein
VRDDQLCGEHPREPRRYRHDRAAARVVGDAAQHRACPYFTSRRGVPGLGDLTETQETLKRPVALWRYGTAAENDAPAMVVDLADRLDRDLEAPSAEPALRDDQRQRLSALVSLPPVEDPDGSIGCVHEVVNHPVEHVRRAPGAEECHMSTVSHPRRDVDP